MNHHLQQVQFLPSNLLIHKLQVHHLFPLTLQIQVKSAPVIPQLQLLVLLQVLVKKSLYLFETSNSGGSFTLGPARQWLLL